MGERWTSRRAILAGFAATATVPAGIGLAKPGAGAAASPDAALIRTCNEALIYWDEIDARAIAEDWDDEAVGQHVDRLNGMLDTVISTRPTSRAGQAAKARVVAREVEAFCTEKDRTTQLVESLLQDLVSEGSAFA